MTYLEAVRYLLSLGRELGAPTQAAAAKFDLENILALAERLGRPDRAYPSVHIAGTNGKGSTAALLESILRHAGFRTGLNTSPHLETINERIRIGGENISDADFAQTLSRIVEVIEELLASGKLRAHPTYFECVTALAFEYFARRRVEFAVFETGLGGRLDATNIVTPVVSVITRIDFDHENFLGHSLPEIAAEKAGILKERVPVVMAEQRPEVREVIVARARELDCRVIETAAAFRMDPQPIENGRWRARVTEKDSGWFAEIAPPLPGRFQLQNALNAVAVARLLEDRGFRLSSEHITEGIRSTVWPGRLEKLQSGPDVYLDGAHNPSAAREREGIVWPASLRLFPCPCPQNEWRGCGIWGSGRRTARGHHARKYGSANGPLGDDRSTPHCNSDIPPRNRTAGIAVRWQNRADSKTKASALFARGVGGSLP